MHSAARIAREDGDSSSSIPEAATIVVFNTLLFVLIFGLSATVSLSHLRQELKNKYALATGLGMQFLIMPFLGFLCIKIFSPHGFTSAMGIMLLIVTSSPGGTFSNWFCSTFNADLSLSVAMTSMSTLMSAFMLPANLVLYSYAAYGSSSGSSEQEESVLSSLDFTALFISLGVVIGGILSGLYASWKMHSPQFSRRANRLGTFTGLLLIVVSLVMTNMGESGSISALGNQPWSFFVGTAIPCFFSLILSTSIALLAKLRKPEVVAIGIEVCFQNINLATSSAVTMFTGDQRAEALLVPLFYGLIQAFATLVYVLAAWKVGWTKAPPNERFCTMVGKVYEVDEDEEDGVDEGSEYLSGEAESKVTTDVTDEEVGHAASLMEGTDMRQINEECSSNEGSIESC